MIVLEWNRIQDKWLERWQEDSVFQADVDPNKEKFFLTVAYPYPNSPQHIGHGRTYTLTDVYARYKRMQGFNVLFPMAFHYTGTPILAMSERIESGDKELIQTFIDLYNVPKDIIASFKEPINIAKYFHQEIKTGMIEMGYSIDWRREFTTVDPTYSAFIEWQFAKLKEKDLITIGSHPVGWCPKDKSPVGQHDTSGDVEPDIGEYTLIMFQMDETKLPAATLRPETIYGVTNLWIRPDATYIKATVNEESWIISKETANKLQFLNMKIEIKEEFSGRDLIGKKVVNPVNRNEVNIFPASFVDPKNGTGIVMSVPAHAPYDFQALKDLIGQTNDLNRLGLSKELVESIKIPVIIFSDDYDGVPSQKIIDKMGIKSQSDPNLEYATADQYRHEFHVGKLNDLTGKYSGMSVYSGRNAIRKDLLKQKIGIIIYEIINRPVICRCGTECVVKIFENQWFIDYSNPQWKSLARKCLEKIRILPDEIKPEFDYTIGWLKEKACARKSGLGTHLPWDREWIIESLSDSVIYMAYYIISKYVNILGIKSQQLDYDFFEFIFFEKGNLEDIATNNKIDMDTIRDIRTEFVYFYPLDSRHSGRDLVSNHLTFFIFNHSAIFPENNWPHQIVVNGTVLMDGKKMSKSIGNIIPLRNAIKTYGADALRLAILSTAELLQDADFSLTLIKTFRERIERLYDSIVWVMDSSEKSEIGNLKIEDRWIISRLNRLVIQTTDAINKLRLREAIHTMVYLFDQDMQWYLRRSKSNLDDRTSINVSVLHQILEIRVKLLAPFAPFISEEMWELLGHKSYVSVETWPKLDESKIDLEAEESENLIKNVLDDTLSIIRVTKIKPSRIIYYTSSEWKWIVYSSALSYLSKDRFDVGLLIRNLMSNVSLRNSSKEVSLFAKKMVDEMKTIPQDILEQKMKLGTLREYDIIDDALEFLKRELAVEVSVYSEDNPSKYDPKGRASFSKPHRPAIFIE